MAHKTHLFSKKKSQEMSLHPTRPRFIIETVVGGRLAEQIVEWEHFFMLLLWNHLLHISGTTGMPGREFKNS
ncbi:hypothetical protein E2C01_049166 [Portunus trituberculatus]|uniref:Uncharacterized protein n=1 Tax=Portunus trituberculatus TaxID=210409 RepID=A0A5B7GCY8_PORTR|nr:hypothetical protein [Portunus trituberculatus]